MGWLHDTDAFGADMLGSKGVKGPEGPQEAFEAIPANPRAILDARVLAHREGTFTASPRWEPDAEEIAAMLEWWRARDAMDELQEWLVTQGYLVLWDLWETRAALELARETIGHKFM